ncbi:MAG: hypothetical protein IJ927_02335 [Eubacterium sp.]|nr:hypothetical protein [Eubacterium sp.]
MKKEKIISILLCICFAISFAACTKQAEQTAATTQPTETTTTEVAAQIAAVSSEVISFYDATDNLGNILKLSPIYAADGKTVVAAYVVSATDKDKKALDAKAYTALNCVIAAKSSDKGIELSYDSAKKLITVESYADNNGNIVAIMDINDINKNGNKTEYIKLSKKTNEKGSVHYVLTNETVEIKVENGKKVLVEKGKKTEVKIVDASNDKVKKTVASDTASSSEKPAQSGTDNKPADTATPQEEYVSIVLKKNGKAACSATGVEISDNKVEITKADKYRITSETDVWHGAIIAKFKNDEEAELRFEDVHISVSSAMKTVPVQIIDASDTTVRSFIEAEATAETTADNAIETLSERDSAPEVDIVFPTGTKSSFENSANLFTGVLYNEAKLTVKGNGKATFKAVANANNVISTSKSVTVKNVDLTLESANHDVASKFPSGGARGIFSYSRVKLESGKLTIKSNGDSIRCDSYEQEGGTLNAASSACDGIDADDLIDIEGGSLSVVALEKTALKVRRVNNQDKLDAYIAAGSKVTDAFKKTCIRAGKNDGFKIDGGTVRAESYKTSTPRNNDQKVIICKASKQVKGNDDESKKPVKWKISGVASSNNSSVKFLYSASGIKQQNYTITVDGSEKDTTWTWKNNVGIAKVVSSTSV